MTANDSGRLPAQEPTASTLDPDNRVSDAADTIHGELRARYLNEVEQHAIGWHEGFEAGYAAAHADMAAWFAPVSRLIRQRAGHLSYAERAAAEAEWIKPKPGDFTGRLSPAEYFGADAPAIGRAA